MRKRRTTWGDRLIASLSTCCACGRRCCAWCTRASQVVGVEKLALLAHQAFQHGLGFGVAATQVAAAGLAQPGPGNGARFP